MDSMCEKKLICVLVTLIFGLSSGIYIYIYIFCLYIWAILLHGNFTVC